jgi:hypothetical protein
MRPILLPFLAGVAATTGLIVLAAAPIAARAQGSGMNCYAMTGGRAACMVGANALVDRLGADVAERNAAIERQKRLVRKVAQAVHEGRCADALDLALKASDPRVAADTARLCGVPDPDAPRAGDVPRS